MLNNHEPFFSENGHESCTTIISAEINGRLCLAMDIAPIYVDLAVRRWQQFTGRSAVREGDGGAFDDLFAS